MQVKTSASSNSRLSNENKLLLRAIRTAEHIHRPPLEGTGELIKRDKGVKNYGIKIQEKKESQRGESINGDIFPREYDRSMNI